MPADGRHVFPVGAESNGQSQRNGEIGSNRYHSDGSVRSWKSEQIAISRMAPHMHPVQSHAEDWVHTSMDHQEEKGDCNRTSSAGESGDVYAEIPLLNDTPSSPSAAILVEVMLHQSGEYK